MTKINAIPQKLDMKFFQRSGWDSGDSVELGEWYRGICPEEKYTVIMHYPDFSFEDQHFVLIYDENVSKPLAVSYDDYESYIIITEKIETPKP